MEVLTKHGFAWVAWETEIEANLKLRNVGYPLYIYIVDNSMVLCDLWSPSHISTIANYFLNDSDCFFEEPQSHTLLRLLFELRKMDMNIRNGLYIRCPDYNGRYQKEYR